MRPVRDGHRAASVHQRPEPSSHQIAPSSRAGCHCKPVDLCKMTYLGLQCCQGSLSASESTRRRSRPAARRHRLAVLRSWGVGPASLCKQQSAIVCSVVRRQCVGLQLQRGVLDPRLPGTQQDADSSHADGHAGSTTSKYAQTCCDTTFRLVPIVFTEEEQAA